jgi:hypothetical protein
VLQHWAILRRDDFCISRFFQIAGRRSFDTSAGIRLSLSAEYENKAVQLALHHLFVIEITSTSGRQGLSLGLRQERHHDKAQDVDKRERYRHLAKAAELGDQHRPCS